MPEFVVEMLRKGCDRKAYRTDGSASLSEVMAFARSMSVAYGARVSVGIVRKRAGGEQG